MDDDAMNRAERAYFRRYGRQADIPANYSGVEHYRGRDYAVLRNGRGTLAVYLVGPHRIRQLDEWPRALDTW